MQFAKKDDLINLETKVDQLGIDKLQTTPANLNKLTE